MYELVSGNYVIKLNVDFVETAGAIFQLEYNSILF